MSEVAEVVDWLERSRHRGVVAVYSKIPKLYCKGVLGRGTVLKRPQRQREEDTVIQTLERGYTLDSKVIRPAKVAVSK